MNRTEVRALPSAPTWVVGLGALCFALSALEAQADPTDDPPTVTVNFADLNIDSPAGARVLYRRIASAARTVCGLNESPLPPLRFKMRQCYQTAISEAVEKIDSRTLLAVHKAKWKDARSG